MPLTRLSNPKDALAQAFGAAAEAYHSAADVQREVAARLARRIAALPLPPSPIVLEIGCGTGFLFHALRGDLTGATWLLSDLAAPMVARARQSIGVDAAYVVMDGERPAFTGAQFDLICANLAFQWFDDLGGALARLAELLRPGGAVAFSTLAAGSFPEWLDAHRALGIQPRARVYPSVHGLRGLAPEGFQLQVHEEQIARPYRSAHAFLSHWKQIGTDTPDPTRAALTPGTMRRLLRRFEGGITVTYNVVFGVLTRN